MLVTTTNAIVQAMSGLFRLADARLARTAARNAAAGVTAGRARVLEDARTMRDLRRLELRNDGRDLDDVPNGETRRKG